MQRHILNPIPKFDEYGLYGEEADGKIWALQVPDRVILDEAGLQAAWDGEPFDSNLPMELFSDDDAQRCFVRFNFANGQATYLREDEEVSFDDVPLPLRQETLGPWVWLTLVNWTPKV